MTDYLSALRTYLLSQPRVTDLCDREVYVLSIPGSEDFVKSMPKKVVVLIPVAGDERMGLSPISHARVDSLCFGATDIEAFALSNAVSQALKDLDRKVFDGVLLHSVTISGGAAIARDPDKMWPAMRRPFTIRADERKVGVD